MKYLITLAASLILFQAGSSQVKTNFTKQNYEKFFLPDCIPKDLAANGHILIIKSPFESADMNSKIEEIFKTYYKSPFIVTTEGITLSAYPNRKIYKYGLGIDPTTEYQGDKNEIAHAHYALRMLDIDKLVNPAYQMPDGLSKKEQKKCGKKTRKKQRPG
jgi:hypothetical protein